MANIRRNSGRIPNLALAALAAGALLFSASDSGQAATTQSLVISAAVPLTCSIVLATTTNGNPATFTAGTPSTAALSVAATGTTTFGLVQITETCNDKNGYKLTLTSANTTGTLKGAIAGNTDTLSYTISYDTGGANTTVTPTTTAQTLVNTAAKTPLAGNAKQINAVITNNLAQPDTYSDTLTFTMTPN